MENYEPILSLPVMNEHALRAENSFEFLLKKFLLVIWGVSKPTFSEPVRCAQQSGAYLFLLLAIPAIPAARIARNFCGRAHRYNHPRKHWIKA